MLLFGWQNRLRWGGMGHSICAAACRLHPTTASLAVTGWHNQNVLATLSLGRAEADNVTAADRAEISVAIGAERF